MLASISFADINDARRFIESGQIKQALAELDLLITSNPKNPEARFLKGVALQAANRHDDAIDIYTQLAKDFPELPEPYNNLAVLYAEKNEFDKAEDALRAAIKTNKSYATAYENLGDIYAQRASIAYNDALNLSPSNRNAVEVKLSMIDNILLPPASRKQIPSSDVATVSTSPSVTAAPTKTVVEPNRTFGTPSNEVRTAVLSWAEAWSSRNVDDYLSYYANSFQPPNGTSRRAWAKYRGERLAKPSFIIVNISQLQSRSNADGTVTATFVQDYQSDGYRDKVQKTLILVNTLNNWKIQSEDSKPL